MTRDCRGTPNLWAPVRGPEGMRTIASTCAIPPLVPRSRSRTTSFPLRRVDSRLLVVAPARHVVDARAVMLMLPLMLHRPPVTCRAVVRVPPRRLPLRHSQGGTTSPRYTPRLAARAADSSPTYAFEYRRNAQPPATIHALRPLSEALQRRNEPTVAVPITFLASNRPSADPSRKRRTY